MGIPVIELLKTIPDVLGINTNEQPRYEVIDREGNFEIRRYPGYRIARTFVQGEYRQAMNTGFRRLAGYIFGKNRKKEQMSMTSPVLQEKVSERMAMTAPVFQQDHGNGWTMTFVMPEKYSLRDLPSPTDPNIQLDEVPEQIVATLRYSGNVTEAAITEKKQELLEWLHEKGRYSVQGQVMSAQYDPPFAIPFFKRNEVIVNLAIPMPRRTSHRTLH